MYRTTGEEGEGHAHLAAKVDPSLAPLLASCVGPKRDQRGRRDKREWRLVGVEVEGVRVRGVSARKLGLSVS